MRTKVLVLSLLGATSLAFVACSRPPNRRWSMLPAERCRRNRKVGLFSYFLAFKRPNFASLLTIPTSDFRDSVPIWRRPGELPDLVEGQIERGVSGS